MRSLNRKKRNKLQNRVKNNRYVSSQLYPHLPQCKGNHQFGHLELAGPASIAAKVCKLCSFLLYKDQVAAKNAFLRENRPKQHIDLFNF